MATPEFPMFLTKRTPQFDRPVPGFYMVPAALRASLIAAEAASDTFDGFAVVNNTPPLSLSFSANAAINTASPVGTAITTATAGGGTAPYTYSLKQDANGFFAMDGAALETAKTPLVAGTYLVRIQATDANGAKSADMPRTIVVGTAAEEARATTTRKALRK